MTSEVESDLIAIAERQDQDDLAAPTLAMSLSLPPGLSLALLESLLHGPEGNRPHVSDPEQVVGWAASRLDRAADLLEDMVTERRKLLQQMAVLEREIDRSQAESSRLLALLTKG